MDPVCHFIADGHRRFVESRRRIGPSFDRKEFLPVHLCKHPGCGKFFVPERLGNGNFCSDKCRIAFNRPGKQEWADWKWVDRLDDPELSKGVLGAKLRSEPVRSRLEEIQARWQSGKRKRQKHLAERAANLLRRAGSSQERGKQ